MTVTKFPAAFDLNRGDILSFSYIRRQFFMAVNSGEPEKALKELRKIFNLVCPHCKQAGLTFSFGSQNPDGSVRKIAGSRFKGQVAHLKTLPDAEHASGCIGTVFESEGQEIDDEKGWRIHLNLGTIPQYNPKNSQLVRRLPNGRIITLDNDLKNREPWDLSNPEKIISLIRSKQVSRLKDSVVVYGDTKIPWDEFYVPHTTDADFTANLTKIIQNLYTKSSSRSRATTHPILMVLDFKGASFSSTADEHGNQRNYLFSRTRPINLDGVEGFKNGIVIVPEMKVKNEHLFEMMRQLQISRGKLLVIAESPVLYKRDGKTNVFHLAFSLTDPNMIHQVDIEDGIMTSVKREVPSPRNAPQTTIDLRVPA